MIPNPSNDVIGKIRGFRTACFRWKGQKGNNGTSHRFRMMSYGVPDCREDPHVPFAIVKPLSKSAEQNLEPII